MTLLPAGAFSPVYIVPVSGHVRQVGYRTEATVVRGERFLQAQPPGGVWVYVDVTAHARRYDRVAWSVHQLTPEGRS